MILGVWLFFSPWLLGFYSQLPGSSWNFFVVGAAFVGFGAIGLVLRSSWQEWLRLVLGVWLIVAPWLLFYNDNPSASTDSVVVGAIAIVLAIWTLGRQRRSTTSTTSTTERTLMR